MKITKYGHCCLLIEHNGKRILTDPGDWAEGYQSLEDIDIVLITHEHGDHIHVPSVKEVLANNPNATIVTNNGVGEILDGESIEYKVLTDGNSETYEDILFAAYGTEHAEIYNEFGACENTGYLIDTRLFYPGDALTKPGVPVEILALPVEAPWLRLKEAIEYALAVNPKVCFPVHDARLRPDRIGATHRVPEKVLPEHGIKFIPMKEMDSHDFK